MPNFRKAVRDTRESTRLKPQCHLRSWLPRARFVVRFHVKTKECLVLVVSRENGDLRVSDTAASEDFCRRRKKKVEILPKGNWVSIFDLFSASSHDS